MISVVILGSGNVAYHLTKAFLNTENVIVKQLYARSVAQIQEFQHTTSITDDISLLATADVYILAISDNAISEVSSHLQNKFVVHTSGSVTMNSLQNSGRKGVFYPLQSFSKSKQVNFNTIPFCLEAETTKDYQLLERLAKTIGSKIFSINSLQRSKLHVAAVFVNNFVNHMYTIGNDICDTYDVPFEVLLPLIEETSAKISAISPKDAQTGPAKRNDTETISKHLEMLNESQKEVYKLITKSIQNGEKL
ncbi:Rossmann-like and DUF2520 domain-containing protein [Tenacibaculum amylolyticum]|uniref:Rossmann-like and DUF2520 domain-containing protein n=1 Tax=Tenacibaculum amylolyticum TaxID=104269 RepID=UPI003893A198